MTRRADNIEGRVQMIDRASGVPAFRQIAAELRARITNGTYAPGTRLPSERTLLDEFGVSRITIREAISLLRAEGVVTTKQGSGVFVKEDAPVIRLSATRLSRAARAENEAAFLADAKQGGFATDVDTEVRTEPASPDHAAALGVAPGTKVIVRDRLMRADGHPVQLAVSRLPHELTRGTPIGHKNPGPGGIYARLEETGITLDHFTEAITTRMPTRDEMSRLQLAEGIPVLAVRRVAYDTTGRAVEVNDMVLAGDRYELTYAIPAT